MLKRYLLLLGMPLLFLCGCSSVATFDYNGADGTLARFPDRPDKKSCLVMTFLDRRGILAQQQDGKELPRPMWNRGSFYLGFVPLIPAGFVEKYQPERSDDFVTLDRFEFNPTQDLTNAAQLSLKNSNLFSIVERTPSGMGAPRTDYIFQGEILKTYYSGTMFSYCVTYFLAAPLWTLGCPNGSSYNELALNFTLIDRSTGKIVWTYQYRNGDSITHWIYARVGKDTSLFAPLMKQAMNQALDDLNQHYPSFAAKPE